MLLMNACRAIFPYIGPEGYFYNIPDDEGTTQWSVPEHIDAGGVQRVFRLVDNEGPQPVFVRPKVR
jgi:hypothetical protein